MLRAKSNSLVILISLIISGTANAQIHPAAARLTATTADSKEGRVVLHVTNRSQVPITSLVAIGSRTAKDTGGIVNSVRFFDSALNPGRESIAGGKAFNFSFFGPATPSESLQTHSVELKAAIFEDGSTWGDAEWIDVLLRRRTTAYKCENDSLQAVMDAKLQGASAASVMHRLEDIRGLHMSEAKSTSERQMVDFVFSEVKLVIQDDLKKDQGGSATVESLVGFREATFADAAIQRLSSRIQQLEAASPRVRD